MASHASISATSSSRSVRGRPQSLPSPYAEAGRAGRPPRRSRGDLPKELPVRRETGEAWWLDLPERELRPRTSTRSFWPEEGYTKGDLLAYYFNVADLLLPHLERRPLTMKRMPDGMDGDSFYEKTAPSHTPDWVHRVHRAVRGREGGPDRLPHGRRPRRRCCSSRTSARSRCTRCTPAAATRSTRTTCFFDLDPFPPYTYEDVLTVARHIKVVLDQLGLAGVPEDERRDRTADLRADRGGTMDLRRGAGVRRRVRPHDRPRRPRPRHDGLADRRPHRQDLHRPQHEPAGREHRGRLFAPARAARAGLDTAHVGRGHGRRLRAPGLPDRQRLGPVRRGRRPVGAGAGGTVRTTSRPRWRRSASSPRRTRAGRCRGPPRAPSRRKTSDEIAIASKDPALFEYVRRREFGAEGTTRAGAGRRRRHRQLVRDPQAPRDAAALRRPARARRRAAVVGRPQGPADAPRATSAWRCTPRSTRSSTGSSRARSPRATTAPARCASSTTGGTSRSSGPTRRSRSGCTGGGTRGSSSTSSRRGRTGSRSSRARQTAPLIASPPRSRPMLAEGGHEAFDDDGWWFEPKLDGIRCLAELSTGETVLRSRTGRVRHRDVPRAAHDPRARRRGERRDRRRDRRGGRRWEELLRGRCSSG